jgi:hypothetical protein
MSGGGESITSGTPVGCGLLGCSITMLSRGATSLPPDRVGPTEVGPYVNPTEVGPYM